MNEENSQSGGSGNPLEEGKFPEFNQKFLRDHDVIKSKLVDSAHGKFKEYRLEGKVIGFSMPKDQYSDSSEEDHRRS